MSALSQDRTSSKSDTKIWANLVHLGFNMWAGPNDLRTSEFINASPDLRFDQDLWDDLLQFSAASGVNMFVLDIGEGMRYESHPELAANGAWSTVVMRREIARARQLGIELIPKLNFSSTHDIWLGSYHQMLGTPQYYQVVKDLIEETVDVFDKPRLFHLGMDEETYSNNRFFGSVVLRQGELWWRDFHFYVDLLEKANVRPWVWSDMIWHHEQEYLSRMPKTVLQSNWFYYSFFVYGMDEYKNDPSQNYIRAYETLDKNGYDQMPTGSNWSIDENFIETVRFCKQNLSSERLLGFLQTSWRPTVNSRRYRQFEAVDMIRLGRELYNRLD